jgi:hypothetical protein
MIDREDEAPPASNVAGEISDTLPTTAVTKGQPAEISLPSPAELVPEEFLAAVPAEISAALPAEIIPDEKSAGDAAEISAALPAEIIPDEKSAGDAEETPADPLPLPSPQPSDSTSVTADTVSPPDDSIHEAEQPASPPVPQYVQHFHAATPPPPRPDSAIAPSLPRVPKRPIEETKREKRQRTEPRHAANPIDIANDRAYLPFIRYHLNMRFVSEQMSSYETDRSASIQAFVNAIWVHPIIRHGQVTNEFLPITHTVDSYSNSAERTLSQIYRLFYANAAIGSYNPQWYDIIYSKEGEHPFFPDYAYRRYTCRPMGQAETKIFLSSYKPFPLVQNRYEDEQTLNVAATRALHDFKQWYDVDDVVSKNDATAPAYFGPLYPIARVTHPVSMMYV